MSLAGPVLLLLALGAPANDPTAASLTRCLADPRHAATGEQTNCEVAARGAYDWRMNTAYAAILRRLPSPTRARLRAAQRAWLAFRTAEAGAREALYATRQETMYVPMAASAETRLTRDRALQLEAYLRVLQIES